MEQFHVSLVVFFHFKTSLQLFQLFRRLLQLCFAVKLQTCFVRIGEEEMMTEF